MAQQQSEALLAVRARLRETTHAITDLLAEDLSGYPERELQRRFVASETADGLSDAQVTELRQHARDLGKTFAAELRSKLSEPGAWEALANPDVPLPEDRRTLRGVEEVWQQVARIDPQVEALADRFGLPADERTPPGYTPPARFIKHLHLPTLTEKYFKDIVELRRLSDERRLTDTERRKQSRAQRWEKASD